MVCVCVCVCGRIVGRWDGVSASQGGEGGGWSCYVFSGSGRVYTSVVLELKALVGVFSSHIKSPCGTKSYHPSKKINPQIE